MLGSLAFAFAAFGLFIAVKPSPSHHAAAPSKDAVKLGCSSCHSTDGSRSEGPSWKGLYGSTVTLADGSSVVADEDYIRRSILTPQAQVAAGGLGQMPTVPVTEAEVKRLIAYIKSIS